MLALEVLEHSLELERLEVRECQAAAAEDVVATREARIQQEVDQKVVKIRVALLDEHRRELELHETCFELQQVELEGTTTALSTKLAAAEHRERAAKEAQASAQADLASAQADLSSLQQQVAGVTSLVEKATKKACHRRTMQREHS